MMNEPKPVEDLKMKDASFVDIPLDRAVALVRACQKLNCDTAEQLLAMVERRVEERLKLRAALVDLKRAIQNSGKLNGREYTQLGIQVNDALNFRG